LYKEQQAFAPTWSADGKWIAFDAGGGNKADIWRIPAEGGQAERIIASDSADWSPTYSPDGNYLCYISNRSGQFDLWIHDLKNGEDQQVTNSHGSKSRGFWSHDARKLAYFENCSEEDCCRIFSYDLISQKLEEILNIPERRSAITDKLVWKADDSALYYLFRAWLPLCEVSIKTKKVKIVLNFKQGELTPSGNRVFAVYHDILYFVSSNEASDIWIAEGLR
jgi:Tol biopolymer transport system component